MQIREDWMEMLWSMTGWLSLAVVITYVVFLIALKGKMK